MLHAGIDIQTAIVLFGLFVSGTMVLVMMRHRRNQARGDLLHLIGSDAQPPPHSPTGRTARTAAARTPTLEQTRAGRKARCPPAAPRAESGGQGAH